jgi:TetR/AcrR family transcriptional repressor of nem operon
MGRTTDTREKLLEAAIDLIWAQSYGSVSVDQICDQAGVRKGSFYHFFPSKIDLAVAACEAHWTREIEPIYAEVFRPELAPAERIERWCEAIYREQKAKFDASGHVPGCPFCSLGAEMGTQSERLRTKTEELLERGRFHLERALRDGQRGGSLRVSDPVAQSHSLGTFVMGAMLQARLHNDPEVLRALAPQVLALLGAAVPKT